jgi:hypothetical protein
VGTLLAPVDGLRLTLFPSAFADSPLLSDPEIDAIAAKHGVPPATVLISYQNARGIVVIPKSVSKNRIESNLKVRPLSLLCCSKLTFLSSPQLISLDMSTLNSMAAKGKQQRVNTPLFGWDLVRLLSLFFPYSLTDVSLLCRASTIGTLSRRRPSSPAEVTSPSRVAVLSDFVLFLHCSLFFRLLDAFACFLWRERLEKVEVETAPSSGCSFAPRLFSSLALRLSCLPGTLPQRRSASTGGRRRADFTTCAAVPLRSPRLRRP